MSNSNGFDIEAAYRLLLARRDRAGMPPPPDLDDYWRNRLTAAVERLERIGVTLNNSVDDAMLAADLADHMIDNRDQPGGMPAWLRAEIARRWQHIEAGEADAT